MTFGLRIIFPCMGAEGVGRVVMHVGTARPDRHPLTYQMRLLQQQHRFLPKQIQRQLRDLHQQAVRLDCAFPEALAERYMDAPDPFSTPLHYASALFAAPLTAKTSFKPYADPARLRTFPHTALTVQSPGDSLLRAEYGEALEYCFDVGKMLWLEQDRLSINARALFMGLALYVTEINDLPNPCLSDIYQLLLRPRLLRYLNRLLDTEGGWMSPLAFRLLSDTLAQPAAFLQRELFPFVVVSMADFALDRIKHGRQEFAAAKHSLRRALLHPQFVRKIA